MSNNRARGSLSQLLDGHSDRVQASVHEIGLCCGVQYRYEETQDRPQRRNLRVGLELRRLRSAAVCKQCLEALHEDPRAVLEAVHRHRPIVSCGSTLRIRTGGDCVAVHVLKKGNLYELGNGRSAK